MPPKSVRRGAAAAAAGGGGGTASRQTTSQAESNTPTGSASSTPQPSTATGTPSTRAPVQRLQTLKKRTPSGSIGSAARTPAATTPGNGEPAKPTLKYKPRAVGRRSKEEREAIEKLEAERNRERLAEVAAMRRGRGNLQRGRGGPGRGRGGPGGPLGGGRRGRGGRFETDSRASSMSRSRSVIDIASGSASRHVSSDESDTETILPIDQIEVDSDEELDEVADSKKGKVPLRYANREKGLRPVRVERREHEERVVSVNMESSTSKPAEAEAKAEDEVEEVRAKKTRPEDDSLFVRDDDEIEPQVKEEPVDEDQTMTDAAPHVGEATHDDGFLPAQKVKVRRRLSPKTPEPEPAPAPAPPSKPAVAKDPRSLLRTKEDIEEYERHAKDLEAILELLSVEPKESRAERLEPTADAAADSTVTPETAVTDKEKEEKEAEDAEEDETKDKLAGQLFLMQFPPMTPNLIVPGTGGSTEETTTEDTQAVPGTTRPGEAAVKLESGEVEILDGADGTTNKESSKILTAADWQLRAGRVGKLNVHKSGRVTMDWGGISFELDRATSVDFLQEALIVSAPEEGIPEEENRVWAMGQLSGKFTVTPDWEKML
ncbi:hypothetical protein Asppvi_008217 [Aspergillus pseudoviridinutans]|uniref:RNA polymerase III RPC4-domain-containing protein n=1 Tax=Aspergillus pseudoviridinutans TaxID=1517512 RepID=A0A9P3BH93_9EURO|nr:uncharacterized protein Asppvi_008217 [Aspergillus pseudoviridinutans]GIJ89280.1 hypothetical protein Asppvi_008217 [Aspergillus pseudoviridinutans]